MPRHARDRVADPVDNVFLDHEDNPLSFPEPEAVSDRRRRRRGLFLTGGVLVTLVGLVVVLYFSPLLALRTIEFSGNDLLTDARAQELGGELYGQPLPQISTGQVRGLLQEENAVAEVSTRAELPHTLHVEITEHQPVAMVHEDDSVMLYNDAGDVIRTFSGAEVLDAGDYAAPEIASTAALGDEVVFRTIASVLGQLPAAARHQMDSATADSIDSVQLQLSDGRVIVWGSDQRGGEKATVLEVILGSEAEEFTEVDVIDISTPNTPVTQ